jgi:hypothetical protein
MEPILIGIDQACYKQYKYRYLDFSPCFHIPLTHCFILRSSGVRHCITFVLVPGVSAGLTTLSTPLGIVVQIYHLRR